MKKVIIPFARDGANVIYPDTIDNFANTIIVSESIIADYIGEMDLPDGAAAFEEYVNSLKSE